MDTAGYGDQMGLIARRMAYSAFYTATPIQFFSPFQGALHVRTDLALAAV